MNVARKEGFNQVCVWPGTVVGADRVAEFEGWMLTQFYANVQYLEEVKTAPDYDNGSPVKGTGGRTDLFFAIHDDDIGKFAIPRMQYGVRWIEDVYGNGGGDLYPERIAEYQSWDYAS